MDNISALQKWVHAGELNPQEHGILNAIAFAQPNPNGWVRLWVDQLCKLAGISRATYKRWIKKLIDRGVVERQSAYNPNRQKHLKNYYRIKPPVMQALKVLPELPKKFIEGQFYKFSAGDKRTVLAECRQYEEARKYLVWMSYNAYDAQVRMTAADWIDELNHGPIRTPQRAA